MGGPKDCTHVKTDLLKKAKEALQYWRERVDNKCPCDAAKAPIKISESFSFRRRQSFRWMINCWFPHMYEGRFKAGLGGHSEEKTSWLVMKCTLFKYLSPVTINVMKTESICGKGISSALSTDCRNVGIMWVRISSLQIRHRWQAKEMIPPMSSLVNQ